MALGDSYSSRESDPPYEPGTADASTGDFCHRSTAAYPELLASPSAYDLSLEFYACSGASTVNIVTTGRDNEPPQVNRPGIGDAALTTLTIGGNDADFGSTITYCVEQNVLGPGHDIVSVLSGGLLGSPEALTCAGSSAFRTMVTNKINSIKPAVENAYDVIRTQVIGANTPTGGSVIAAGYPELFPSSLTGQLACAAPTLLPPTTRASSTQRRISWTRCLKARRGPRP